MPMVELVTLSKQKEGYYQLQFVDIDNVLYTFFVSESVMFTISELYNRGKANGDYWIEDVESEGFD